LDKEGYIATECMNLQHSWAQKAGQKYKGCPGWDGGGLPLTGKETSKSIRTGAERMSRSQQVFALKQSCPMERK
jgi:hypothetical protein